MAKRLKLFTYQRKILRFILSRAGAAVFVPPGLGKTAAALAAVKYRKNHLGHCKTLVIAPLVVAYNTWVTEVTEWDMFSQLSVSLLHGKDKELRAADNSDIHVINPEGLKFLLNQFKGKKLPYDMLIVDESTKFKNHNTQRFKMLRRILPQFTYRVILTGTPMPRSLLNLFPQMYIVDLGATLGNRIGQYRERYFRRTYPLEYNNWEPRQGSHAAILDKIKDSAITLKASDYRADYKPLRVNNIYLSMDKATAKKYRAVEEGLQAELQAVAGALTLPPGVAQKYGKLRQIASGGLYTEGGDFELISNQKLDRLTALQGELQGANMLVGYHYRFTRQQLINYYKDITSIDTHMSPEDKSRAIADWNRDRLPILFGNAGAMAHGLNLHKGSGRDIVWLTLPEDLEVYEQFNARIYGRTGVTEPVTVHNIIIRGTVEEVILKRLQSRSRQQESLLDTLRDYYNVKEGKQ